MNYWLVKSEPGTYSWEDLEKDKKTVWDGVRNFQARANLKAMKKGDIAFFYHSNVGKEIVGIVKISKAHFPDPTDKDWIAVELVPFKKIKSPVSLANIKANKKLAKMALVRSSRLSVQPVSEKEYEMVIEMSQK
ncbi:MAG: EVE domain-containing protein [Cyclobacteriaceae bacterium]